MNETILSCTGLGKKFGSRTALSDLNFSLQRGKIVGLLGPNGSGKTTLIKLANGLLKPSAGEIRIAGQLPGPETKAIVSYLPDRMYIADWMRTDDLLHMFSSFYADFDRKKAEAMLQSLGIGTKERIKTMSKGTKEKVQLVMVMSRSAQLYLLDEPIGGVDPAARDFILKTILTNYSEHATVVISTHLISDVEKVLDEVLFLKEGRLVRQESVDRLREEEGKSVDALFREIFAVGAAEQQERTAERI